MLFFNRKSKLSIIKRNYDIPYLIDKDAQHNLAKNGYTVLKNIVSKNEIDEALDFFEELKNKDGYEVNKIFRSTGNFKSFELQQSVFNFIGKFMLKIAPRFAYLENCEIGKGGAFFIKPNSKESQLEPHQDSTVIDETISYAVFVWMPLTDITENNGSLYVLPKSHLWGNFYRSQHIPWSFRNLTKQLWNEMTPVYANKGDIIIFDSSIIHGSSINYSDKHRIAICGALLPKNYQMVDYLLENKKIIQYKIDENYWLEGGLPANLKKYNYHTIDYDFPNPIKKRDLDELLTQK